MGHEVRNVYLSFDVSCHVDLQSTIGTGVRRPLMTASVAVETTGLGLDLGGMDWELHWLEWEEWRSLGPRERWRMHTTTDAANQRRNFARNRQHTRGFFSPALTDPPNDPKLMKRVTLPASATPGQTKGSRSQKLPEPEAK